ncbi:DNA-binding MarR family transcriptional regulator [Saccharothrix ecbatanensis]|uniref:DNA-binding MarR family transcriptional regulator n=1 Tax=Saccharothrix ecbatanensis TaxID=1105145 RepID=A0A7W9HH96_9PSEU|nr:MarR family transcriptional regulator [Saccharothrix ecbatanensis]MBB5802282.1 DNA-binding MarR family transcriptional regulator [Saccharothrix ecbatanensis]
MRRGERKLTHPDLGVLTSRLLLAVQEELFDTLARQGFPDLRPLHGAVLAYLDPEGTRATDIARRSGQHKQVVGKVLDELEALGYVTRHPDPCDRRAKLVMPTERGLDQMVQADAIMAAIEQRNAERVGCDGFGEFKRLFGRITENQRAWRGDLPSE